MARRPVTFVAVGDVHGHHRRMVSLIERWIRRHKVVPDAILQVGDFEPHRHADDLATMAGPSRHKALGDFHLFASGAKRFPWPVYFIGGNHEPYGWLDHHPGGLELTHNCHYIGRAGAIEVRGVRVVGLSGVHAPNTPTRRPDPALIAHHSNKDHIWVTHEDVDLALDAGPAHVLLTHDWPDDVLADAGTLDRRRLDPGNPHAQALLDLLTPQFMFCGHMHTRHERALEHPDGRTTTFVGLGHILSGADALYGFTISP